MSDTPPIAGEGAERFPKTIEVIERGRRQELHQGVQFCVRLEAEVVADLAVGESPDGRPFTPDTLMPWLSAGKPLTAVAILRRVERGQLSLDEPVARTIPEFAANDKEAITLRHVLMHTAGIAAVPTGWPQTSWDEIVARICQAPVMERFRIGEDAAYDPNRSWFILGEILRRSTGLPVDQLLRTGLCEALGMENSWPAMTAGRHGSYGERIGVMSARDASGQLKMTHGHTLEMCTAPSPGSSWRGPMHDLAKFYEALRLGGEGNGQRILNPQTVVDMTSRHRVGLFDMTFQHRIDFGLGVVIDSNCYGKESVPYGFGRHCSERAFGHGGAQSSIGFADPDRGLVVAAVANGMPGEPQHNRRFRELNSAIYEDLGLAANG